MKEFELNQNILASKDSKKIIKLYNKIAKTLVAFEYLWYQAWINSIEQAKAGMYIYDTCVVYILYVYIVAVCIEYRFVCMRSIGVFACIRCSIGV